MEVFVVISIDFLKGCQALEVLLNAAQAKGMSPAALIERVLDDEEFVAATIAGWAGDVVEQERRKSWEERFAAALIPCNFSEGCISVVAEEFSEECYGILGEGHVLGQPPRPQGRDHWTEKDVYDWLVGPEVAGKDLEAASLADGIDYTIKNQEAYKDGPVIFWASRSWADNIPYLNSHGEQRCLDVSGADDHTEYACRFLLRKVRKPWALGVLALGVSQTLAFSAFGSTVSSQR